MRLKIALLWGFLLLSALVSAMVPMTLDTHSGESLNIDTFPAPSDTLLLMLPSERGLGKTYARTADKLAALGVSVWAVDLHKSYMVAPRRSSIGKFNVADVLEVIAAARERGFQQIVLLSAGRGATLALDVAYQWQQIHPTSTLLTGQIFHSPHLIAGKPALGQAAVYGIEAGRSNLPIYLLLSEFSTKYFRHLEMTDALKQGGSAVFVQKLAGVGGGFFHRALADLSIKDLDAQNALAATYLSAINLLKNTTVAPIITTKTKNLPLKKARLSMPKLSPYAGKTGMALRLKTTAGAWLDLADFKGQVVLLNFWASWCAPCVREIPSLMRLQAKLAGQPFQIVTVNIGEDAAAIKVFADKLKFTLPILLDTDGAAAQAWGVYAYPSNFVLDKTGVIRFGLRGALEWDDEAVIDTISTLFR